ncbi:MAG: NGG1p interacting factor NIF3 [Candidatus Levybacteria bacterium]|nr:NGG1p interacting factor NIF3 [Candidatus Levybacteria bacterium]
MTLQQIYDLGLFLATKADPRGEKGVKFFMDRLKKDYQDLPDKAKKLFDKESLNNPYSDSRILFGDPKTEVKKVLAGIDADASEILLADRLNQRKEKIDLVISHHPLGHALAGLYEVMDIQIEMFAIAGVPVNISHALMQERKGEVQRKLAPLNHNQAIDTARLLNIPLLSLHTVWDNLGNKFMQSFLSKKTFHTVGEVLDYINEIPEFIESTKGKAGPFIAAGNSDSRAGKVAVGFTGGTSPSTKLYGELAKAGIGTLVEMHVPEETLIELKKLHINVIDCGHMAADSIGANIFLDALEKKNVEVIPCSGLIRVKRK